MLWFPIDLHTGEQSIYHNFYKHPISYEHILDCVPYLCFLSHIISLKKGENTKI